MKKHLKVRGIIAAITAVALTGALCTTAFASQNAEDLAIEKTVYLKGDALGISTEKTADLNFDYRWLTNDCGADFNADLAEFASLLSANAYGDSSVSLTSEGDALDNTALLSGLGFEDTTEYAFLGRSAAVDSNDQTSVTMAHRVITVDEQKYNVFVAVLDGTDTYRGEDATTEDVEAQWLSNFDIGADTAEYYNTTGAHPEWTNKAEHKGFNVAANRAQEEIDAYLEDYAESGAQTCLLLCGHSRGGAIANILGTVYEEDDSINSRTYTFSSPLTTTADNTDDYRTIFNVYDKNDTFANMPLATWGFDRYGVDYGTDVEASSDIRSIISNLADDSYTSVDVDDVISLFMTVASNREDLYDISTFTVYYDVDTVTESLEYFDADWYSTAEDAGTAYILSSTKVSTSRLPFLKGFAKAVAHRDSLSDVTEIASYMLPICETSVVSSMTSLLTSVSDMASAHLCVTSYAISQCLTSAEELTHTNTVILNAREATLTEDGYTGDTLCKDCNTYIAFGKTIPHLDPQAKTVTRLQGDDALGTMAAITQTAFADDSCTSIVVATLGGYWDALTASGLAGALKCPVLMTSSNSLSASTKSEIRRLASDTGVTVYISGGTSAVSDAVKDQISAMSCVNKVVRMAGEDAMDTAVKTYETALEAAGAGCFSNTCIIATDGSYYDALSSSPYSYACNAPIFLAHAGSDSLSAGVIKAIKDGGFERVIIAGGTSAVSTDIATQLKIMKMQVTRLGGSDAFETSQLVAEFCLSEGMVADNIGVATFKSYHDALSGTALCGSLDAPIILVGDDYTQNISNVIAPNAEDINNVYVFGGTAAISQATYKKIVAVLG